MTDSNKVATNQDDDPNLFDLSNDPIATDDTIEKVKAFLVELQPKRFRTIEALVARIDTLTAENEKMKERESELIDRLSCIYSSLESMWLSDDFAEGFSEDSADESTLVRHSLFTGEVRMIHKILAPLRRTGQDCFLKGDV